MASSDETLAVVGLVIRVKKVMPYVIQGLAFTVKALFTRTFTEGVESRSERSGIITVLRTDEDIYLNLLSMHFPLTKKNVTLIGQTITPLESFFKVFSHRSVL